MNERELTRYLLGRTAGLSADAVVGELVRLGVISLRRCEQHAIRTEVEHLARRGAGRCEAMESAAVRFHCSYAKVRQAVYYKPKK